MYSRRPVDDCWLLMQTNARFIRFECGISEMRNVNGSIYSSNPVETMTGVEAPVQVFRAQRRRDR